MLTDKFNDYLMGGVALTFALAACYFAIALPKNGTPLRFMEYIRRQRGDWTARIGWIAIALLMLAVSGTVLLNWRPSYARPSMQQSQ